VDIVSKMQAQANNVPNGNLVTASASSHKCDMPDVKEKSTKRSKDVSKKHFVSYSVNATSSDMNLERGQSSSGEPRTANQYTAQPKKMISSTSTYPDSSKLDLDGIIGGVEVSTNGCVGTQNETTDEIPEKLYSIELPQVAAMASQPQCALQEWMVDLCTIIPRLRVQAPFEITVLSHLPAHLHALQLRHLLQQFQISRTVQNRIIKSLRFTHHNEHQAWDL